MSRSMCCVLVSVLLLGACQGLGARLEVSEDQGIGNHRNLLQTSHSGHDDHDHDEGEEDGNLPVVHEHDPSELPADHLIEVFGEDGKLEELGLDALIHLLNVECGVSEDPDSHQHHHGHGHGKPEDKEMMTAGYLADKYGDKGVLDSDGLMNACPDILRCQLDDNCLLSEAITSDEDDENVTQLKIVAASVFVAEVAIGAILPMILGNMSNFRIWLAVLNCFSGGVFLAAGFLHMIPHVLEYQSELDGLNEYPLGLLIVVIGFILVLFIEHVVLDVQYSTNILFSTAEEKSASHAHHTSQPQQEPAAQPKKAPKETWSTISHACVILMAITVHALLEAIALGLEQRRSGVLMLFAAVASHKGVAAMALSARFIQSGASKTQIFILMGIFAVIAPIGIGIGLLTEGVGPLTLVILDSLSAGSFIYVGAYEVISEEFPHAHEPTEKVSTRSTNAGKFLSVTTGILVISLLQLIPHE